MSANPEHGVSNHAIVFKYILEELISKIPNWKKKKIYNQHCKKVQKRNNTKAKLIKTKNKSKIEYAEKPMKEDDYICFHVVLKLLETEYAAFIDTCTLSEIGYILNISRERVRQVEYKGIMKIKSPKLLHGLNKNNAIEAIMEYKEHAIQRKNTKRRKRQ
ncbi:hypothetical protein CRU96_05820 [Malaciobacter halophilus]|nr:sigma factor-like helix-turn-helix DNA-binding protein [Malaciobacter halophilus]RYA23925.1 hypothetical protein CRU96_05820 [Malaciobacter halophilus]